MTHASNDRSIQAPWPPYAWPQGVQSAFCFSVDVDEQSPLLWGLREGPPSRLLGHAEQRAFGSRVGIWRLLDMLDRVGVKGSFYVPALVAERHPQLLPAFIERGHEIGLHGYFHELAQHSSDAEFEASLEASLDLFQRQTGERPAGFRSPAWEMTPFMLKAIHDRGLYDSSLAGFDHPYTLAGVVEVPVQWLLDDAIYFKFLGGGVDHWPPSPTHDVAQLWRDEWQALHRFGGLFMLTVHDWISGRAHRVLMLERLLQEARSQRGCWVATVGEVARYHAQSVNRDRFSVPAATPEWIGPRRWGQT
jgi:peptidoglycan/xylan/chitin deacetylase (PgdA/CDA1 family)